MKKAANILLLVGAIMAICSAVGYLIGAIVYGVLASPALTEFVIKGLQEGSIDSSFPGTAEEQAVLIQAMFVTLAVVFGCLVLTSAASVVFSFKARNTGNKVLIILALVFSVLSSTIVGAVGAVFGLIKGDTIE